MKLFSTIITYFLFNHVLFCQLSKGDLKMAVVSLDGIFQTYDTKTKQCKADALSAKENTVIKLIAKIDDSWIVKAVRVYEESDQIKDGGITYCISEFNIETFFIDFTKKDYGILSLPFKGRLSPFNVYPGGTLGGYFGRKFVTQKSSSSLIGFGGLSSIPLNDANSDVVDNKFGITIGGGYIWYIDEGFQIGALVGWDFFDGVEKWTYKYQPWISFSVGYGFTSNSKQKRSALQALQATPVDIR